MSDVQSSVGTVTAVCERVPVTQARGVTDIPDGVTRPTAEPVAADCVDETPRSLLSQFRAVEPAYRRSLFRR